MKRTDYKPIQLFGTDDVDLQVMSAYLQDMLVQIQNVAWQPQKQRFVLMGNRFCWELARKGRKDKGPYFRVKSGCHFDDVLSVRSKNIDLEIKDAVFNILSITASDQTSGTQPSNHADHLIVIHCGGGGQIELHAAAINSTLSDISEPWPTGSKPDHTANRGRY